MELLDFALLLDTFVTLELDAMELLDFALLLDTFVTLELDCGVTLEEDFCSADSPLTQRTEKPSLLRSRFMFALPEL